MRLIVATFALLAACGTAPAERIAPTPERTSSVAVAPKSPPAATATRTPRPRPRVVGGAEGIADLIRDVFGEHAGKALSVARCESNLNPRAVGRAGERGLFQIHPVHRSWVNWSKLFDPEVNVRAAYRLFKREGWRPWTCA